MVKREQLKPLNYINMTLYTLENSNGMRLEVSPYVGIIKELWVPDRQGDTADIVLGLDHISDYKED